MQKFVFVMAVIIHCAQTDRVYENECPAVPPMLDFDMQRFLGVWYQVQPESDTNPISDEQSEENMPSCESYNIMAGNQPQKFVVNTNFELYPPTTEPKPIKYETKSVHTLTVRDDEHSAMMRYAPTFGPHVIESNFTIFATDYESYAIISNCDKEIGDDKNIQFSQHASIWSRTQQLNDEFVNKLIENYGSFDFDPYDLSDIKQTGCLKDATSVFSINLDAITLDQ